jgi:4-hydroxy-3-methylbut-2-enyl diphosphate reductase IspH
LSNSSNSQRLREVAERVGCPITRLLNRAEEIDWSGGKTMSSVVVETVSTVTSNRAAKASMISSTSTSGNSSNSQRLREVAERVGCPITRLLNRAEEIDWSAWCRP